MKQTAGEVECRLLDCLRNRPEDHGQMDKYAPDEYSWLVHNGRNVSGNDWAAHCIGEVGSSLQRPYNSRAG